MRIRGTYHDTTSLPFHLIGYVLLAITLSSTTAGFLARMVFLLPFVYFDWLSIETANWMLNNLYVL